jgi:sulfide:quinone oxidoreductase
MPTTLIEGTGRERARVLIAGGGVAALETLLALAELAPDHVAVELLAPQRELTIRALSVAEPFGLAEPQRVDLGRAAEEHGARLRVGELLSVARHRALTRDRHWIDFDSLVIATGTRPVDALQGALSFYGPESVPSFRELLGELEDRTVSRLAFVVPDRVRWSLPIYELALMTAARCAALRLDPEISVVTREERPLELFGVAVSDQIGGLLDAARIRMRTGVEALAFHSGRLLVAPPRSIVVDRVVALPRLRVPYIEGVPRANGGFIPVDDFGRVEGLDGVYAAGDVTWHAVKQGGLATQQADAVATAIAAAAGAPVEPKPFEPVLRGVLLTGTAPLYLTGENSHPGATSTNALWWPPAKVAGRYLGPYLADVDPGEKLHDVDEDHHPALELALAAADAAAGWGDHAQALRWLGVAERLNVVLPEVYAEKRREWRAKNKEAGVPK